jgi:hypothetical protein
MRELRVDHERLQAVRDSLTIANLRSRLDLVAVVRPDKVYHTLIDQGFAVPSGSRLRFVLYPEPIREGHGSLTARLSGLVVSEEQNYRTNTVDPNQWASSSNRQSASRDAGH